VPKIFIDFETRSTIDIKKVGAWAYAAHPSTDVLCLAYSIGNERTQGLLTQKDLAAGKAFPIPDDAVIVAHSAHFEYPIYNEICVKRYNWKPLEDPSRWSCTLSRAAAANLPLSLDSCGAALGITQKKDLHGRSVMLKLCRPTGFDPLGDPVYNEDPELLRQLYAYCQRDVAAEMELDARLPELSISEKEVWNLDLIINRRGVQMDVGLARARIPSSRGCIQGLSGGGDGAVVIHARSGAVPASASAHQEPHRPPPGRTGGRNGEVGQGVPG
jgi:DNA polymerase